MLNMNILIWNCWGALNPTFKNVVIDLVQLHSLAIMIVTETKVGDNRAKEITSQLPFDGAIVFVLLVSLVVSDYYGILPV